MKRTAIAVAWLIGTTVPMLVATVFVFGCCVLPFHGVIHKAMPLCHYAMAFFSAEHDDHDNAAQQSTPAREKREVAKRNATEVPESFGVVAASSAAQHVTACDATTYRSFIALGAIRCDRDVGLHLVNATLLI